MQRIHPPSAAHQWTPALNNVTAAGQQPASVSAQRRLSGVLDFVFDLVGDHLAEVGLESLGEAADKIAVDITWVVLLFIDLPITHELLLDVIESSSRCGEGDFCIPQAQVEQFLGLPR